MAITENEEGQIFDANSFRKELAELINKHSKENGSDTPDWILADYLIACLATFDISCRHRENWYGRGRQNEMPMKEAK